MKKINQKEKKVSKDDNENIVDRNNSNTAETNPISEDLTVSDEAEPNEKLNKDEEVSNGVLAVEDPLKAEPETTYVTVNESDEADGIKEDISEDDPEFIGPKLPPRMTKEEIKAFYDELIEKLKFPS